MGSSVVFRRRNGRSIKSNKFIFYKSLKEKRLPQQIRVLKIKVGLIRNKYSKGFESSFVNFNEVLLLSQNEIETKYYIRMKTGSGR